ncbi:hypothetical protein [Bacillus weihaiensis]|uniref:hypothetical protein n=1 Tax=Bacillus weihaiensis TaxID=1547283 RepID=UPI002352D3B6|nr:hypothetical protein [Bacillus weihaiensis]
MSDATIKQLRLKQLIFMNGTVILVFAMFLIISHVFPFSFNSFIQVMAVITFIQAIVGLFRLESTKSLIPFVEEIARYEKEKLGREWIKRKKSGVLLSFILGIILLNQSMMVGRSNEEIFRPELWVMILVALLWLLFTNIELVVRSRKIDQSDSSVELTNFTSNSIAKGLVIGLVYSVFFIVIIVFYIL